MIEFDDHNHLITRLTRIITGSRLEKFMMPVVCQKDMKESKKLI